jgi:DNA-directed RNA polymerase specialized sigma24 family protein
MPTRHADPVAGRKTQQHPMEMMLRHVPALHREIIVATYFRRQTTREAAWSLGLTPVVAKARLYAAMRELSLMIAIDRPSPAGPGQVPADDKGAHHHFSASPVGIQ